MDEPSTSARLADWYQGLWALSALRVADERGLLAALDAGGPVSALATSCGLGREVTLSLVDVLSAIGFVERAGDDGYRLTPAAREAFAGSGGRMLLADLRATLGQHAELWQRAVEPDAPLCGWRAQDPAIVLAQAEASEAFAPVIAGRLVQLLPDLARLVARQGARMLDVGAGAAGGLIGFAAAFPTLRFTGLEPSPVAFACAERAVAERGLGDRIELRACGVEQLDDDARYALAYVAQMFFPDSAWAEVPPRVLRALEPGGYLVTAATSLEGEDLPSATSRLRTSVWGGGRRSAPVLVDDLLAAGFAWARAIPVPLGSMIPVLARKAD